MERDNLPKVITNMMFATGCGAARSAARFPFLKQAVLLRRCLLKHANRRLLTLDAKRTATVATTHLATHKPCTPL